MHNPAGAVDCGQAGANKGTNMVVTSSVFRGCRCGGRGLKEARIVAMPPALGKPKAPQSAEFVA
jgi:hypothetical protein